MGRLGFNTVEYKLIMQKAFQGGKKRMKSLGSARRPTNHQNHTPQWYYEVSVIKSAVFPVARISQWFLLISTVFPPRRNRLLTVTMWKNKKILRRFHQNNWPVLIIPSLHAVELQRRKRNFPEFIVPHKNTMRWRGISMYTFGDSRCVVTDLKTPW